MGNRTRTLVYTVFAFRVMCIVQSIFTTSVVRLKCDGANAEKCIGTYILPNTLITTSLCAEICQYAENIPIIQRFIHKHYKNYVAVNGALLRNDIALLVTNSTNKKLVKLSALDHVSPLGQKAFVPIFVEDKPKLQVAVIQRCIENHNGLKGYYVCTNNIMAREVVDMCMDQEQGTPLLLDDKIYGVMSLKSKDSCTIPQRRFTAIGPALSWISSTAEKYINLPMEILRSATYSPLIDYPDLSTEFNTSSMVTDQNLFNSMDQNETLYSNSEEINENNRTKEMEQLLAYFVTKKPLDPIQHKLNELKQIAQDVHILRGGNANHVSTVSTTPTAIAPLRPFASTAITFIPWPRSRLRSSTTERQALTSVVSLNSETTHVIPFVKDLGNNKSTNIMDWFRNELKRMDEHPHFLVLSTTTTPKPIFIDLT